MVTSTMVNGLKIRNNMRLSFDLDQIVRIKLVEINAVNRMGGVEPILK